MKLFGFLAGLVKKLVLAVVLIELLAFGIVTISNWVIYGTARENKGARYDAYTLFLNDSGPVPTANPPSKGKEKQVSIWCFGGSTMREPHDNHDRSIPSLLTGLLNRAAERTHFSLVNYGENSFNSLLEVKYLQKVLAERASSPQAVIFYDGANDAVYFARHRTPYAHHGFEQVKGLIESYDKSLFGLFKPLNAALYSSYCRELYDKFTQVFSPTAPDSPALVKHVELCEMRYDYINKIMKGYGAEFHLYWQPLLWVETGEPGPAMRDQEREHFINTGRFMAMRESVKTINQAIYERLKNKPYFVDLRNSLLARVKPAYQPDGVHLTDYGRELVGQAIFSHMKKSPLFGPDLGVRPEFVKEAAPELPPQ